jgi:hypothetical protein
LPTLRGAVRERAAAEGDEDAGQKLARSKIHGGVALAAEREAADAEETAEGTLAASENRRASRRMTRTLLKRMVMKSGWRTMCRMFGAGKQLNRPSYELLMGCPTVALSGPAKLLMNERWSFLGQKISWQRSRDLKRSSHAVSTSRTRVTQICFLQILEASALSLLGCREWRDSCFRRASRARFDFKSLPSMI